MFVCVYLNARVRVFYTHFVHFASSDLIVYIILGVYVFFIM